MKTWLTAVAVVAIAWTGSAARASDAFVQSPTFTATRIARVQTFTGSVVAQSPAVTCFAPQSVVLAPRPVVTQYAPQSTWFAPAPVVWGASPAMPTQVYFPSQPIYMGW
jgi:hypothetical protein